MLNSLSTVTKNWTSNQPSALPRLRENSRGTP